MKQTIRRFNKKTFAAIAMIILAGSLVMTGCLRAPIEQGPVTNTNETTPVITPEQTTASDPTDETSAADPDVTQTDPEETHPDPKASRPAETILTIELEGMEEEIKAMLYMSDLGYSMYYDFERYQVVETSGRLDGSINVDEVLPLTPAEELPDIFMQVGYLDMAPEQAMDMLRQKLEEQYSDVRAGDAAIVGEDNINARVLMANNGTDWDSEAAQLILISNDANGSYFFHMGYFVTAAEGHGSRFIQMLDTFRVD